jgi:hypothetical protein
MHFAFFCHEFLHCFLVHFVRNTTVNRANSSTLGLFMKTLTLRTFIGNDEIGVYADRSIFLVRIYNGTIEQGETTLHSGAVSNGPFHTAFINGVVGTLRFTGTAIDTLFGDLDSHNVMDFLRGQ